MRVNAWIVGTAALLSLTACGGADKGGNSVQMKDMEVVDGTATDAMTDLDGVQSEGTAIALPGANAAVVILHRDLRAKRGLKPRPRDLLKRRRRLDVQRGALRQDSAVEAHRDHERQLRCRCGRCW